MRTRSVALGAALVMIWTLLPAGVATAAVGPTLRLFAVSDHVDAYRYGGRRVYLDLGAYLGVTGIDLEIQVFRPTYADPIEAALVLDDDSTVPLPSELLDGWRGFHDFFHMVVFRGDERVHNSWTPFCPNGWDLQRLDDSGPREPTFPYSCGGHAFTRGSVWGVDQGWAVGANRSRPMRLPDGDYTVRLSLGKAYRDVLSVPDEDASITVDVTVLDGRGCEACRAPMAAGGGERQDRLTAAPIDTDPDPASTADLVALPAFGISTESRQGRDLLTFGANVWNRGPAPLVVEGFRAGGADVMDAYQYFFLDGEEVGRAPVGYFELDEREGHHHWHFLQFARYRVLDAGQTQVVRSHKQSFCLAPTDAIDLLVPGALWRTDELGFSRCGGPTAIWIRETLPTGWGDTYYQGVAGQAFDITEVPNGTYFIEVTANPTGLLYDAHPGNDTRLRRVVLGGEPGRRTVSVPPWHGIDTG